MAMRKVRKLSFTLFRLVVALFCVHFVVAHNKIIPKPMYTPP